MTPPAAAVPPITPARSTDHPVDRLYRALASNAALAGVSLLVGTAWLASLLLPQLPADRREPEEAARWLADTASGLGALGNVLAGAGLLDLWRSPWFQALVGLLAFVLLLRLGLAIGEASRRLLHVDASALAADSRRWPLHALVHLDRNTAGADLHDDLVNEGWWVTSHESDDALQLTAERSRVGVIAPILICAGLLLVLTGLWLGQFLGWQESGITLAPGQTVVLSRRPATTLGAAVAEGGALSGVEVVNGDSSGLVPLADSGGARVNGLTIRRRGEGPTLDVSVADAAGEALQLQRTDAQNSAEPALTLVFDQPRAEQVFLLPARELAVSIVSFPALPERGFSGPTFLVQAFRVGQQAPVLNEFTEGDATLGVGEDTLLLRAGQFVTVDVSYDPLRPLTWLGVAVALLGVALALWRPAGRLFLSAQRGRDQVAVQVSLEPAWSWRQAGRWLAAWSATYEEGVEGQEP